MEKDHSFVRWSTSPLGLAMIGGSLGVMLITAWLLFGGSSSPGPKGDYRYMHCPECSMETIYNPELSGAACFQCRKGRMVPTRVKLAESGAGPTSTTSKMIVFGFIAFILLQAVVYVWATDRDRDGGDQEEIYKCRCPTCKRKFAYPASKAGISNRCVRCKTEFQLPAI